MSSEIKSMNPRAIHEGLVHHDGPKRVAASPKTSNELSKIECLVDGEVRGLFIPAALLKEMEAELKHKLTGDDAMQILTAPSILKAIEEKLNQNKPPEATGKELRGLSEEEVRAILTSNGVAERHVNVNDNSTFYLEAGDPSKETVLLIHGGGNSASYRAWKYQIMELAKEYHVIAPDLPGYGNTPKPHDKCTLNFYVQHFFGGFMDALNIDNASVVSSSMGGWIALGFTLENPSRVNKLVGIGSGGVSDRDIPLVVRELIVFPGLAKFLITKLHNNKKIVKKVLQAFNGNQPVSDKYFQMTDEYLSKDGFTPAFLEFVNDQLMSSPKEVAADFIRDKIEHKHIISGFRTVYMNSFAYLNKANVPYLLAHGRNDPIFNYASTEESAEKLENCTLVPFDCMHSPHLEVPKEFNPVLLEFLSPKQEPQDAEGRHRFKHLMRNITDKLKRSSDEVAA